MADMMDGRLEAPGRAGTPLPAVVVCDVRPARPGAERNPRPTFGFGRKPRVIGKEILLTANRPTVYSNRAIRGYCGLGLNRAGPGDGAQFRLDQYRPMID